MKSLFIKVSKICVVSFVVCMLLLSGKAYAEDILIIHQSFGNTHLKWKNRLEAAGHTVTSQTSEPSSYSGYEQVLDLRYSDTSLSNLSGTLATAYKTILAAGGTVVLNGENPYFDARNTTLEGFVRHVTGDNTITYHDTNYIDYEGNNEYLSNTHSMLDSLPSGWTQASWWAGGVISDLGDNGKCLAQNAIGECGVALWDGDALSSAYSGGKVIIITDINYASQSSYYTNDNKEFINALIADVTTSTVDTRSAVQSGITSAQQTIVTATQGTSQSNNKIYINQSGSGVELAITQDGDNNLVIGPDLSAAGQIIGDDIELTITQTNDNNIIGIDIDGNSNDVDITQNLNQSALIDITGASNTLNLNQTHLSNSGEHFAKITIVGSSNVMDIDQTESGDKILFLDVDGSNNVTVDQKGTGDHFLDITLTDSHTVDVTQDGSGDHSGTLNLSGNNTSITLTQDSSSDQNYYLSQNCTQSSCSVTVTQN